MATNKQHAMKLYKTLVGMMDAKDMKYDKKEEDLLVLSGFKTDDFPVEFFIRLDAERDLAVFMSKLPFSMPEDKRVDGAIAVCVANNGIINGTFDYDITTGDIWFRMSAPYCGNVDLSAEVFEYLMIIGTSTIDEYNDKLFMLSKGMISVADFMGGKK